MKNKQKSKQEKKFYNSLKPKEDKKVLGGYWYGNQGAKLPNKEFKPKKPRFITFKLGNSSREEEKPLFEDSILSDIVKNQESKLHGYETKAGDLSKLQKSNYSKVNNTTLISKGKGKGVAKGNISPVKANNPTSLELIKKVCEEFGLTRREVFEIHSQYKAMTIPYERTKDEGPSINDDYFDALKKNKHPELKNGSKEKNLNDSGISPQNLSTDFQQNEKLDGIKLDYFAENCTFLNGVHPEVKTRLFKALGIDTESRNSVMRWEEFVELYCICELGKLQHDELIRFWIKFLDPTILGSVSTEAIEDILEKLVRGTSLNEPNQGTQLFAKSVIKIFDTKGWVEKINEETFVNIRNLREAFTKGEVDLHMFSEALGNKVLTMSGIF